MQSPPSITDCLQTKFATIVNANRLTVVKRCAHPLLSVLTRSQWSADWLNPSAFLSVAVSADGFPAYALVYELPRAI